VNWAVLELMQGVPAKPSQDADLPSHAIAIGDIATFYARLGRLPGLSVDAELAALKVQLQIDFDGSCGCPLR
jgi:hypothetical protein